MLTHGIVRPALAMLAIPLLLAAMSACSTTDTTGPVPTPSASNAQSYDSYQDYQLAFAKCMRDHGIDMPDPTEDGQKVANGPGFTEAVEACGSELGDPPAREGGAPLKSDEERRAEDLKTAACLRDHGVDVADPEPGGSLDVPADVPQDALEACAPNGVIMGSTGGGGQ